MHTLGQHRQHLMDRLRDAGMDKSAVFGFIWSLKSLISYNPEIDRQQINKRLQSLGWGRFTLDDQTLQVARECYISEAGDHSRRIRPAQPRQVVQPYRPGASTQGAHPA